MESCLTKIGRDEKKNDWYKAYRMQGGRDPLSIKSAEGK